MLPRRGTRLGVEGWYCLVIMGFLLAGALLREINLLVLLFSLMLAPLAINWISVGVVAGKVQLARSAPATLGAGDLLVVDIQATNRRRRGESWALVVSDRIRREGAPKAETARAGVLFTRLKARETRHAAYEGRLTRRGQYRLGPLRVSTRFPLGLAFRTRVVDCRDTLIVYPRLGRLTPKWSQRRQRSWHGSRAARSRRGAQEADFHGLRDYRPGDSQRWIHWRTTARLGELTVREFEQQDNHDLALFVDLWRPQNADRTALENVELAVSFAATVVADHCRRGASRLVLSIAGEEISLTNGPASMVLLEEAMKRLAVAEATPRDTFPEALKRGFARAPQRADLVVVSTRRVDLSDTDRFAEAWDDPRKRVWMSRALVLDAGGDELFEYFRP